MWVSKREYQRLLYELSTLREAYEKEFEIVHNEITKLYAEIARLQQEKEKNNV